MNSITFYVIEGQVIFVVEQTVLKTDSELLRKNGEIVQKYRKIQQKAAATVLAIVKVVKIRCLSGAKATLKCCGELTLRF